MVETNEGMLATVFVNWQDPQHIFSHDAVFLISSNIYEIANEFNFYTAFVIIISTPLLVKIILLKRIINRVMMVKFLTCSLLSIWLLSYISTPIISKEPSNICWNYALKISSLISSPNPTCFFLFSTTTKISSL